VASKKSKQMPMNHPSKKMPKKMMKGYPVMKANGMIDIAPGKKHPGGPILVNKKKVKHKLLK
jgi:hypothetical protein